MKSYVGSKNATAEDKLFACPADTFFPSFALPNSTNGAWVRQSLHRQAHFDYSSYGFNGGDNITRIVGATNEVAVDAPGLTGVKLSSVKHPTKTVLASELSALGPWSWHDPVWPDLRTEALTYEDAKNMVSFVDGHVSYIRIYWNKPLFFARGPSFAMSYNPPDGYEYQWSAD